MPENQTHDTPEDAVAHAAICSRHPAMKELDAWICEQHPEDSHTLMLYADRMNAALLRLDANDSSAPTT